jgi:uncharacterized protein YdeI (YjbR/CyaY-like superfamily)
MSLEIPMLLFKNAKAWETFLSKNNGTSNGVWLQLAKKSSGTTSVTYSEALDIALCHGWIDGQKKAFDDSFWLQKFTPRGARSIWSKINREKALDLIQSGRMKPAGLLAIEKAKADGRWAAAYDSQKSATVPVDFQAALDAHPDANNFFSTLDSGNRYAILFRIQTAKKPETRSRRVQEFIAMLERKEKIHQ